MINEEKCTQQPFDIGRGSKGKGWIEISRLPGGGAVGIPWMAVTGVQDGPILTVNCGIHGDEYEGAEAIRRVWSKLDPGGLVGTWVGIPVVNVAAFEAAQRVSPLDGVNLNRIFPGYGTSSVSGMVASRFFHDIVLKSDAVLDFHAGGNPLSILPMVAFAGGEDRGSRELAIQTGVELLWKMPTAWSGSLSIAASEAGIPTVTPEIGNDGRLDMELVDKCEQIISNVMIALKMCEGQQVVPRWQRIIDGSFVTCSIGGLLQPTVVLGEEVERGQVVGIIRDVFGVVLEEIAAPCSGVVCSYRTVPSTLPGDQTILVGEVVETLERVEGRDGGSTERY